MTIYKLKLTLKIKKHTLTCLFEGDDGQGTFDHDSERVPFL